MRFQRLADWLHWQESLHPSAIELGLERLRPVWQRLRAPALARHCIVVGGTNGKGSTIATLEAILLAAGYRVGCYTSPHLHRYNERIRIQGRDIDDASLCQAFERVDQARRDTPLTYFEFGTLAALVLMQQAELDVALLEVGLGGRLDAVNLIDADVAVITSIDLDHQQWLGDTREAIAREKFGIARPGRPLILGERQPPGNIAELATTSRAEMHYQGRDFGARDLGGHWEWWGGEARIPGLPRLNLPGRHQLDNAATAIAALQPLRQSLPVNRSELRRGLASVQLPGRFQLSQRQGRSWVYDVAHNPQAAQALAATLARLPPAGRRIAVVAMLADKDIAATLAPLRGSIDAWHLAPLEMARGASAETLAGCLPEQSGVVHRHASLARALAAAEQDSAEGDQLIVFGSFYTVAEALAVAEQST